MKINCVIVDDEPLARKGMLEYVNQVDFLDVKGMFADVREVYRLLSEEQVDLIFLDIEMPVMSGIDFIKTLKQPPFIIFTTAFQSYALEGYELDVIDFLVKPVAFTRFLKAVSKAREIILAIRAEKKEQELNNYFFIKENGIYTKVLYGDVQFAEALQNYVSLHLTERKIIIYITLSLLEKQLPESSFMRIHKSYIIALNKINAIDGNMVTIQSVKIPISRKLRDLLLQRVLENKLLKR